MPKYFMRALSSPRKNSHNTISRFILFLIIIIINYSANPLPPY